MKIVLGGAQFGMNYGLIKDKKISFNEIKKINQIIKINKIKFIDTAINYKSSEAVIGNKLNNLNIITKIKLPQKKIKNIKFWLEKVIDLSLNRLGVKEIYGLLVHDYRDITGIYSKDYLDALFYLKKVKKVKKIGISIYDTFELDKIWKFWRPEVVQVPFNVLDQRIATSGWLNKLSINNVEIHIRSCFLQGLLLGKYDNYRYFKKYKKDLNFFFDWCNKKQISNLKACINFVRKYSSIKFLIVGFNNHKQLIEILHCFKQKKIIIPNIFLSNKINLIDPRKWR
jgi:aryl-alcohol dehydrogenase-like predicted oxidoreductase